MEEQMENNTQIPAGYYVEADGSLWKSAVPAATSKNRLKPAVRVCRSVIRVTNLFFNPATQEYLITLTWNYAGRDIKRTIDMSKISSVVKIVNLSRYGLPVSSLNANNVVKYLKAVIEMNPVPVRSLARVCGWHGNSFLRGYYKHGEDCPEFHEDIEVRRAISSISDNGDLQVWSEAMLKVINEYPVLRLLLATAAAPPLLRFVDCEMWTVDLCGAYNIGKSQAAKIALSMWGEYEYAKHDCANGRTTIKRICETMRDIPLLLEESDMPTKKIKHSVAEITNDIITSKDNKGAKCFDFRTVAITTRDLEFTKTNMKSFNYKEQSILIKTPPWGLNNNKFMPVLSSTLNIVGENYGHAGSMLVDKFIALTPDGKMYLTHRMMDLTWQYTNELNKIAVIKAERVERVSKYLAATQLAGEQLAEVLGWPKMDWVEQSVIFEIANNLTLQPKV